MGAKYYPTVKDQKANLRFQKKQTAQTKSNKPVGTPAPQSDTKKK